MAKRARSATSDSHEVNPDVRASGLWHVYRAGTSGALAINADHLDVTDSGALIFMVGSPESSPRVVVAADQYLYCAKVR
jgi:hypothetical protein